MSRATCLYGVMLIAAVSIFFLVRHFGETALPALPLPQETASATVSAHSDVLLHVLLALVVVSLCGRALGAVCKLVAQPPVIGEVIAGIMLGPSLLGYVWPAAYQAVLPDSVAPFIGLIAQLGVVLYMFTVGLEFDAAVLHRHGRSTIAISHCSIVAPFLLGAVLALAVYPELAAEGTSFTVFALFLGASMSITAFPVLARILTDRKMNKTSLGVVALACAAADDVTAWCMLALVVGVAQSQISDAILACVLTVLYIGAMVYLVRPLLVRWLPKGDVALTRGVVATVFMALLGSAWLTEWIGVHAIFGAFLLGAMIPHDSDVAKEFNHKLEDLVTIVFLPAFFAFTGMRTQIGLVDGLEGWLLCGLIILVATVGKFGGTLAAARLTGMPWKESTALGILMNTRGLMELIVLNIGLDLQVISPRLFAMMVIMAIVTTVATTPLLYLLGVLGKQHQGNEHQRPAPLIRQA